MLDHAEATYTSLLARTLGGYLRELEETQPARVAQLLTHLAEADVATLRRVLLAPETSSRIRCGHPGHCDDRDLGQYLADILKSEAAQPNRVGLVVDCDSRAALCFDYSTLRDGGMRLERYTDPSAKQLAMSRLEAAMCRIDETDSRAASFVRRFTLVANVLVDAETAKFTSGSTSQYVGRSIFCNAHLPGVDVTLVADSLVHEAIHSLLYMHEICTPWILNGDIISRDSIVESPWSGATLLLRPFLQACFVWFGLAHFWALARHGSAFRPEYVEARLTIARGGFLKGPLEARIVDYVPNISPSVLELIGAMQAKVVAASTSHPIYLETERKEHSAPPVLKPQSAV